MRVYGEVADILGELSNETFSFLHMVSRGVAPTGLRRLRDAGQRCCLHCSHLEFGHYFMSP